MKLILYVDFRKVMLGGKVRDQVVRAMKKRKHKIEKKEKVKVEVEKIGKKQLKVISVADSFEGIEKLKTYWAEMFGGQEEEKSEKEMKMSLKDKAQLARGKMTKGVKKKALWITGKLNVKYRYEVIE